MPRLAGACPDTHSASSSSSAGRHVSFDQRPPAHPPAHRRCAEKHTAMHAVKHTVKAVCKCAPLRPLSRESRWWFASLSGTCKRFLSVMCQGSKSLAARSTDQCFWPGCYLWQYRAHGMARLGSGMARQSTQHGMSGLRLEARQGTAQHGNQGRDAFLHPGKGRHG